MSRIEHKWCLISTSYLAGLFDIFILLHIWQNCEFFGDFLPMRTLCDAYIIRNLNLISVQSRTYLSSWKRWRHNNHVTSLARFPQTQIQNGARDGDCYAHAHGCTLAFLPPVIVTFSNFSGVVWRENILMRFQKENVVFKFLCTCSCTYLIDHWITIPSPHSSLNLCDHDQGTQWVLH